MTTPNIKDRYLALQGLANRNAARPYSIDRVRWQKKIGRLLAECAAEMDRSGASYSDMKPEVQ